MSPSGKNIPDLHKNPWWEEVLASEPLTQGDMIENCEVMVWDLELLEKGTPLKDCVFFGSTRAVVMTQACDLEHGKAPSVTLCRVLTLVEYFDWWHKHNGAPAKVKPNVLIKHVEDLRKNNVERFEIGRAHV